MLKNSKIYIAGHSGLLGGALFRELKTQGFNNLVVRTSNELNLTRQSRVEEFFQSEKPEYVFLAAAKVGGIKANMAQPADFLHINLQIQTNIISMAHTYGVQKLIFFSSNCSYPKNADQPICEESLLTGPLEPTNETYALAKIAGYKMCQAFNQQFGTNFACLVPASLYGPGDHFDPENSHVLPALIHRFHQAKIKNASELTLWGSGLPKREFMYVEDFAKIVLRLMDDLKHPDFLNVGPGEDISIKDLAHTIAEIIGYKGKINFDTQHPDGMLRKCLNVEKFKMLELDLPTNLQQGIEKTYKWFLEHQII